VAFGTDGVKALGLSGWLGGTQDSPNILDHYNTAGMANRMSKFDNNIAVSDWDDVEILNWNWATESLIKTGYKNTTRRTMAIATKENFIYSAEWNSVQVMEYGEIVGADIDLNTYELNYPYVVVGDSYTMPLEIINNGNSELHFEDIFSTNPEFIINNFSNLMPGESQTIEVTYTATEENASGGLRIWSNDNDEPDIVCETNGNIDGANIGEAAPDFELEIVANGEGSFRLSDHLGEIVVLVFFAPSWPVCSPELSDIETAIWQAYEGEIKVFGIINTGNQNQLNYFINQNSITFPILFDPGSPGGVQGGDTYDLYYLPNDGSPYPRDFIIDQNGILKYANNEIDTEWMLYVLDELIGINLLPGDLNFDEQINVLDVITMVNIILGEVPTNDQFVVGDLNEDNIINIIDIISLVNYIIQ